MSTSNDLPPHTPRRARILRKHGTAGVNQAPASPLLMGIRYGTDGAAIALRRQDALDRSAGTSMIFALSSALPTPSELERDRGSVPASLRRPDGGDHAPEQRELAVRRVVPSELLRVAPRHRPVRRSRHEPPHAQRDRLRCQGI